jgi:hypothetical protein
MNPQVHGYTIVALHLRSIRKGIESKEWCVLPSSLAMVQGHNSVELRWRRKGILLMVGKVENNFSVVSDIGPS